MDKSANREVTTAEAIASLPVFSCHKAKHQAIVLIAPAMGVPREYYAPFAAWLATQGFLAATFDYRGTGLSRLRGLRGFKANIFD